MGQILDRISRLAQAYWTDATKENLDWADQVLGNEDDELRRAIDALGKPTASSKVPKEVSEALHTISLKDDAAATAIKPAYRKTIAQWHPDKFVNASASEQQTAQHKAQSINAAYVLLKAYFKLS